MKNKGTLLAVIAGLLLVQAGYNYWFVQPRYQRDFAVKTRKDSGEVLSSELLFLQLFGFREFLAGILWVRGDTFFENGNYDAILPIIRLVTWLDPHYIDVYATGMWHLGYNFTDEESRSDRRYIPFAIALGREGAENNPETYELFFETGWLWFHKVEDTYPKAVEWFEKASDRKDIIPARRNLLANAYLRNGEPEKAVSLYSSLLGEAQARWKRTGDYTARIGRDTIENNLDNTLVRLAQRGHFAIMRNDGSYANPDLRYDTKPPYDVGFAVRVTVEDPKVLRIEGFWNVLSIGTRIRVVLKDDEYPNGEPGGMQWDYAKSVNLEPPKELTFMQDQLFVRNRRFNKRIDMSKDPTMYPFTSKNGKYVLEFYYNPRSGSVHMQDKFGYSGEGITDQRYLNSKIRPGQRVIYTKFVLTEEQIKREGQWIDQTPVFQTPNYLPASSQTEIQMIQIPSMRTEGTSTPD